MKENAIVWSERDCEITHGQHHFTLEFGSAAEREATRKIFCLNEYPLPRALQEAIRGLPVIDIGANIGAATAYFKIALDPWCIDSYEPDERARQRLHANAEQMEGVTVFAEAVAGESGERTLYRNEATVVSTIEGTERWRLPTITVPAVSVSDALARRPGPIGVLKVDAEFAEGEIFRSMTAEDLDRIRVIFVEYHAPDLRQQVEKVLQQAGFVQFRAHSSTNTPGLVSQGVFAYAHPSLKEQALARPLKLMIARFPGGGSDRKEVTNWFIRAVLAAKADPRIDDDILLWEINDTPITMGRNRCIQQAQRSGADLLCIVDNDMHPDYYLAANHNAAAKDPRSKPFFESSLDHLYDRWMQGLGPAVVAAPYCGPPPCENVYVFQWKDFQSDMPTDGPSFALEQFTREQAATMRGITEVAALPTGLMLIDMRAIAYTDPPYFYYEWDDETESAKASTEDVTFTRDLSLNGVPQFCNWDAWAGHFKTKCVGRPTLLSPKTIGQRLKRRIHAELNIQSPDETLMIIGPPKQRNAPSRNGHAAKDKGSHGQEEEQATASDSVLQ